LRDTAGNPAHAATSIPGRIIILDPELKKQPWEHNRILLHECFHFVWVRLGNSARRSWEEHLRQELNSGARGEAGWSAEWRKKGLSAADVRERTRRWREYCCESFCDTGAWVQGGGDAENTLGAARRRARLAWFGAKFGEEPFRI
jgi:transposase InsO family protein